MFNRFLTILCLALGITVPLNAKPASINDVVLLTEEYPPYNFTSQGELKGIAVDAMVLMLQKLNSKLGRKDIAVVPWARGYRTLQQKPYTCLFAMTWTKERSKLFKFVGPMEKFDSASLFAKKSSRIRINAYQDLKAYRIGVLRNDIGQDNLTENGLAAHLIEISSPDLLAKMLEKGRIDLWAYGEQSVPIILKSNGINPDDYETVFRLQTGDSYYAFNKDTPDEVINAFQNAYNELVKEGRIRAVFENYLKK